MLYIYVIIFIVLYKFINLDGNDSLAYELLNRKISLLSSDRSCSFGDFLMKFKVWTDLLNYMLTFYY